MSNRPPGQKIDAHVEDAPPARLLPSMKVTKEQLAAAERTRNYHLHRLQGSLGRAERSTETAAHHG